MEVPHKHFTNKTINLTTQLNLSFLHFSSNHLLSSSHRLPWLPPPPNLSSLSSSLKTHKPISLSSKTIFPSPIQPINPPPQNPFPQNHATRLKIWLWVRDCCGGGGWVEFLRWLGRCSCGDDGWVVFLRWWCLGGVLTVVVFDGDRSRSGFPPSISLSLSLSLSLF
jgi:hypothetical protein